MTTIPDFTITKLTIIDGQPNDYGRRLLATFSLHIAGLIVSGCCLTEKEGIAKAHGPNGKTPQGHVAVTTFHDPVLFRVISRRAAQAYSALTGKELADE